MPISPEMAYAAAAQFEAVSRAVSQANNVKVANIGALAYIAGQTFLCAFSDRLTRGWLAFQVVPLMVIGMLVVWFYRYGALQTRDPDYPEAKAAMKRSLIVWAATFMIQLCLLGLLFWRLWRHNL
jgi:hypothetical protein